MLLGLGIIVSIILLATLLGPGGSTVVGMDVRGGWIDGSLTCLIVLLGALAIMILQYRARHTWVSRIIFAAALLSILCDGRLLRWDTTYAVQSHLLKSRVDTSSVTARLSPESGSPLTVPSEPQNPAPPNFVRVGLPILFEGVPTGTTVATDVMMADLSLPNGRSSMTRLSFTPTVPDAVWHYALVERSLFTQVKSTAVRLHITFYLTVLGDPHTEHAPLGRGPYRVPGVELCQLDPRGPGQAAVSCRAAFRQPSYVLARFNGFDKDTPREQQQIDYSPFPAEIGISPIADNNWPVPKDATTLAFTTMMPLAHIRRELDIPSVQLLESAP